jgi:YVTN family beta-propeller protein
MTNALELFMTVPIGHHVSEIVAARDNEFKYVSGSNGNVVSVISGGEQVVATITVGQGAEGLALSPHGLLYVCNTGSASVSVIDTGTNAVVATVGVGQNPTKVAMSPEGTHAYVINYVDNTVSVIRVADHTNIATIPVSKQPAGIAVSADGTTLYVASAGRLVSFDTTRYQLQEQFPWGVSGAFALSFAPGGLMYCVGVFELALVVGDIWLGQYPRIELPGVAADVLIHPDSVRAYVACHSNQVLEVDLTTRTINRTVATPTPGALALSPDGRMLYVANYDTMTVSEFETWVVTGSNDG